MAEQFVDETKGGRTEPYQLRCRSPSGELIDSFVKVTWAHCPVDSLIREAISAMLARDLGLQAAEGLIVEYDNLFVEALSHANAIAAERFRSSIRPVFGSKFAGDSFHLCTTPPLYDPTKSAEIWAFDRLTLNPDRRVDKPNCLWNGVDITLIDHEMALNVVGVGGLVPEPWTDGALATQERVGPHLLFTNCQGRSVRLDRLQEAWSLVEGDRIDEYAASLPDTWVAPQTVAEILAYLKLLRTNVDLAFEQLHRILQ